MSLCLDESQARGTARTVLLAIADRAYDDGTGAWPTLADLSRRANTSRSNVKRAIRALVELGELKVDPQAGGTPDCPPDKRPNDVTRFYLPGGRGAGPGGRGRTRVQI